jgi:hypothetical protein
VSTCSIPRGSGPRRSGSCCRAPSRSRAAPSACSTSARRAGDVVLDRLAELLPATGRAVLRYRKPTFARPAPVDLRHEIATHCEVVIEALAD